MLPDAEALVVSRPSADQLKKQCIADLQLLFHEEHPSKRGLIQLLFLQGTHGVVYADNGLRVNLVPESNLYVVYKTMVLPSSHVKHMNKKTTIK